MSKSKKKGGKSQKKGKPQKGKGTTGTTGAEKKSS